MGRKPKTSIKPNVATETIGVEDNNISLKEDVVAEAIERAAKRGGTADGFAMDEKSFKYWVDAFNKIEAEHGLERLLLKLKIKSASPK